MHILLILFLAPAVIYAGVILARPLMIGSLILLGSSALGATLLAAWMLFTTPKVTPPDSCAAGDFSRYDQCEKALEEENPNQPQDPAPVNPPAGASTAAAAPKTDADTIRQWCANHPDNQNCQTDPEPAPQNTADITTALLQAQTKSRAILWCTQHPSSATCQ